MLDCVHLYNTTYFGRVLMLFKDLQITWWKHCWRAIASLASFVWPFLWKFTPVKPVHKPLTSWCLFPVGRDIPPEVAAEVGRCPVLTSGGSRQYQTWACEISCSVPPRAFGPRTREEEIHLSQRQGGQEQEKGSEGEGREKVSPIKELESLFRRKAWKTKLEGKGLLRQREYGTSKPWEQVRRELTERQRLCCPRQHHSPCLQIIKERSQYNYTRLDFFSCSNRILAANKRKESKMFLKEKTFKNW